MSDHETAGNTDEIARFQGDRVTYIKEHVLLAALGSLAASGILMAMGNPDAWTGVVGAVAAIGARGFYVASEQLGMVWKLTARHLVHPDGRMIALSEIDRVRTIFSAAQVVTRNGDKYMLKYQADPAATKATIEAAL